MPITSTPLKLNPQQINYLNFNEFSALSNPEKTVLMQKIAEHYEIEFLGLKEFKAFNSSLTTGIFRLNEIELSFVPGNTISLGYEQYTPLLDQETLNEIQEMLSEYELNEDYSFEDYCQKYLIKPCTFTVAPMLVERTLQECGYTPCDLKQLKQDTLTDTQKEFLIKVQEEIVLEKNYIKQIIFNKDVRFTRKEQAYSVSDLEILRKDRVNGQFQNIFLEIIDRYFSVDIYDFIGYQDFKQNIAKQGFSLPNANEWGYLMSTGINSIFPFGNSINEQVMKTLGYEEDDYEKCLRQNNIFGLEIGYDPYKQEIIDADYLSLRGGDGGCNCCGGLGAFMSFLPCSALYRIEYGYHEDLDEDASEAECQEILHNAPIDSDYNAYRRIIRLKTTI